MNADTLERLKIISKWGVLLVVVGFVCLTVVGFLTGMLGVLIYDGAYNEQTGATVAAILGMVSVLPFTYFFPYKGTLEYFQKIGVKKEQKYMGMAVGFGVVAISALLSTVLGYFMTGKFNYSLGFLPIALSAFAGHQAEKKFLKKK